MSKNVIRSSREDLADRCLPLLREVEHIMPGTEVEHWLNTTYGKNGDPYQHLTGLKFGFRPAMRYMQGDRP